MGLLISPSTHQTLGPFSPAVFHQAPKEGIIWAACGPVEAFCVQNQAKGSLGHVVLQFLGNSSWHHLGKELPALKVALCPLCCSHPLQVSCTLRAERCRSRPETREMHVILTPGLDILPMLLCPGSGPRMDMFVESSIKISRCI